MKVTIEIDSSNEMDKLNAFFKEFGVRKVTVTTSNSTSITKGDKKLNADDLFGIWEKSPRRLEDIRNSAWTKQLGYKNSIFWMI